MADISKIKASNGVAYSIKDTTARKRLVPTGGTTGQVVTKTESGYGWADASGSNAVSLTQAQYDALPTTEKNNGTVYYIYDVGDTYSENITKNVVLSASKWTSDTYTISDSDITGTNIVFLTYPPSTSDEVYSAIQSANIRVTNQTSGSITLQALGGAPSISLTITLIIQGVDMGLQTAEYVTYDNSTSGLKAVNVQEAVDELNKGLIDVFSYDERKVGTWVDGKPLYRKTVYRSSLPNSTSTNYQHGIANVDTIFLDSGHSFIRWSSGSTAPLSYLSTSYSSAVDVNSVSSTTYTVNTHGTDRSALSGYFTFLYTKTTD